MDKNKDDNRIAKSTSAEQREIGDFFEKFDRISDGFDRTFGGGELRRSDVLREAAGANAESDPSVRATRLERLATAKKQPSAESLRVARAESSASAAPGVSVGAPGELLFASAGGKDFSTRSHGGYGAASSGGAAGSTSSGGAGGRGKSVKTRRKRRLPIVRLLILFVLFVGICVGGYGSLYVYRVMKDTPPIDPDEIYSFLTQSSTVYDDAGNVVENLYAADGGLRTNVTFDEMPDNLVDAFVAIEDKTFWTHHGFNIIRIFGAIRDSFVSGGNISGTSTITQQLARNLWLTDTATERSMSRKVREALYSLQLENKLTKELIAEAYLNTISLGNRAYGVQAAAQAYFSKDVQDLTLPECAALAALPKAPSRYALVQTLPRDEVSADDPNLLLVGEQYAYVYSNAVEGRKNMVLEFMLEQGYISQDEFADAKAVDLRDLVNPNIEGTDGATNYFADYIVQHVLRDLMAESNMDEESARRMLYTGGLKIYSTLDAPMQKIIETEFSDNTNFPRITSVRKDKQGNILDASGNIMLYAHSSFFDADGNFTLRPDEYRIMSDGSVLLLNKNRLNFYTTNIRGETDYSIEFKDIYIQEENTYYSIRGGNIFVGSKYKTKDNDGNLLIDAAFFSDFPGILNVSDNGILVGPGSYSLRQRVVQPQAAMVVIDYRTGGIKAMVGGRNTEGRMLFNRADNPQQPGSAIKPMGVYGPALQMGFGKEPVVNGEISYGTYWTAASGIVDEALLYQGNIWPKNVYNGYRGMQSLRMSVEQSINVNAVKVQLNIGPERSLRFMKGLGVTSVVESGTTNDMNPAALALGGMTSGVSPLEMAAAYGAFANMGLYVEPASYTRITNHRDEVIIEREPYKNQAMDPSVAFIMSDILRTTVTNGIANRAAIASQPVAGKTGTTTDKYDAWFVGFTPQYSASLWIGSDVNLQLSEGSPAATRVWSKIMQQVCAGIERGSFPGAPANVVTMAVDSYSGLVPSSNSATRYEYFISGTEPSRRDFYSMPAYVCPDSWYLATPYCPARQAFSSGADPEQPIPRPRFYCYLHNADVESYPIDPTQTLNGAYRWDGVVRDNDYYENLERESQIPPDDGTGGDGDVSPDTGPWPNPGVSPNTPDGDDGTSPDTNGWLDGY